MMFRWRNSWPAIGQSSEVGAGSPGPGIGSPDLQFSLNFKGKHYPPRLSGLRRASLFRAWPVDASFGSTDLILN